MEIGYKDGVILQTSKESGKKKRGDLGFIGYIGICQKVNCGGAFQAEGKHEPGEGGMRLLGVLRNTSVVSACPASSLPSTIFPLGTHNFFILRVGSLGGADLCPSSPTYQHFPSYSQVQDFWCNPDWREERNVCSCWVC